MRQVRVYIKCVRFLPYNVQQVIRTAPAKLLELRKQLQRIETIDLRALQRSQKYAEMSDGRGGVSICCLGGGVQNQSWEQTFTV